MARPKEKENQPPDEKKPLTPEQCKKLAGSFADLPPEFQLSAEDLEVLEEDVFSKPMRYGSPAKAIEAMERRLAQLKRDKAKTLETLADCDESVRRKVEEALAELNHQIEAAQHRLDAYKFQQRHEN